MPWVVEIALVALPVGLAFGFFLGRILSRRLGVIALNLSLITPPIVFLWRELAQPYSPNDDLPNWFWALLIFPLYAIPFSAWAVAIFLGHFYGGQHRLDQQAKKGGLIE